MKTNLNYLITLVCICIAHWANAQVTLSGKAVDAISQEELIGASVIVKQNGTGAATDINGKFTINLDEGEYTIVCSYVGYLIDTVNVNLKGNKRIRFNLIPDAKNLNEVVVSGEKPNANISTPQMSMQKVEMKQIRHMPAFMGEVDVIKAIQLLPGVQAAAEGSSGFSVRGGDIDQNLITLDNVPVYNASHLMGFFSVFNNDYVKEVTLYKGDLPANYGGRLASLLEVESIQGNPGEIKGKGGIGTISSRLTLEGKITKDLSFVLSGRRSYVDMFLIFAKEEAVKESILWFYDLNGKISWSPDANNRLTLSGYSGDDKMGNKYFNFINGNKNASLKWTHLFDSDFYLNSNIYYSRYRYVLGSDDRDEQAFDWTSEMDDVGTNFVFTKKETPLGDVDFGFGSIWHTLKPAKITPISKNSIYAEKRLQSDYSVESGIFAEIKPEIGNHLKLRAGLRLVNFSNYGKAEVYKYNSNYEVIDSVNYGKGKLIESTWTLEPRFGATWMFNEQTSVKASYSVNNQYIQQARNSTTGTPFDVWFTSGINIKPQHCDQFALGVFQNVLDNKLKLSLEGFYKDMDNAIDFKEHPNLLFNSHLDGEIRHGKAISQGLEFMAEYNSNRLSGWVSYTLSESQRKIEDIEITDWYPTNYDKPHDVSVVAVYKLTDRVTLGANWNYSSGLPFTVPLKRFRQAGAVVPVYSDRNSYRMPDYHRLDLSVTIKNRSKPNRKWQGEWNISIYNAYNKHNAWVINFVQDEENPDNTKAEMTYLFPILPSVTYNFNF